MKYYIEAIRLMFKSKKILLLSLFPMIFSFFMYILFLRFGFQELKDYANKIIPASGFLHYLGIFLHVFVKFALFIISAFLISFIASIFSSPFLSLITREVFQIKNAETAIIEHAKGFAIIPSLINEFTFVLRSQIYFILLGLGVFVISLILIFIPMGFILSSLLTWWFLSLSYLDYSFDLKRFTFKQKITFTQNHMPLVIAMGGLINFFVLIPFINIIAISIATIGNSLMFIDKSKK